MEVLCSASISSSNNSANCQATTTTTVKQEPNQKETVASVADEGVKKISQKFGLSLEQTEQALQLKKEIELIQKLINQQKLDGVPQGFSNLDFLVRQIEGLKKQS